jgi:hypothetical protein
MPAECEAPDLSYSFMTFPFDDIAPRTVDRVFARFGHAASYAPPVAGAAVSCTVILNRPDEVATLDNIPIIAEQRLVEVRKSEVASPAKGGVFTIDAAQMQIVAAPRANDPEGLVWSLICAPL